MKTMPIKILEADKGSKYYDISAINFINFMYNTMPRQEFIGFCKGNIIKYVHRYQSKGGARDLEKAAQYIKWLMTMEEK